MLKIGQIFNSILSVLTPRQREVVEGRFGLDKSRFPETLAAIGDRLKVTRERIRQIEKSALDLLNKEVAKSAICQQILNNGKKRLKNAGGVIKQDLLLEEICDSSEGLHENHLALLLEASHAFHFHPEDENYWSFYYLSKNDLKAAENFIDDWANFLEGQKEKVLAGFYKSHLKDYAKHKHLGQTQAENFLAISKKIHANSYGDIGLGSWPEIRPLTTRDRAYLVMKKKSEPLHFEAIADAINDAKLSVQLALAPTVHNELIKDQRFVLVGRGIYALREHGYEPGIAREVIQRVLVGHGPMKTRDVISAVQKQRLFKTNTIIVNLQNKSFFERLSDGKYRVRKS